MTKLSLPHRLWRWLPAPARRAALRRAAAVLAPVADATPPGRSDGVVIGGELDAATGLGEAARVYGAACAALGLARGRLPLGIGARPAGRPAPGAALLLAVNAPSLPLMLARAPRDLLRGRLVIGAWAWELPVLPAEWRIGARYVHEVWACSEFTAAALEPVLPGRVRVVPYPLAVEFRPAPAPARSNYGIADEVTVTTVIFSLGSSFARKNPLAAIAAFRAGFGDRRDQLLVIKFAGEAAFPEDAARIVAAVGSSANIRVFAGGWTAARVEGLIAISDIVLSLHRAEGLGLVPAQAMLRGIPVVATGWSGNLQYMDRQSAALVGCRLVPVEDPSGVYGRIPGAVWAEPDLDEAAAALRRLGDDPALRSTLGALGMARATQALGGAELRAALAALRLDGGGGESQTAANADRADHLQRPRRPARPGAGAGGGGRLDA